MGKLSGKKTNNGRLYFGDKDAQYLKKVSREAVEDIHDTPILFFQVDWSRSKRNFYGEMIMKKFKVEKGTPIRGTYNLTQNEENSTNGVPSKTMKLVVSVYVQQLEELKIKPTLGDYFGVGKRLYEISDKTIEDVGPGSLMMNRGRMRQDFTCYEVDDEVLLSNVFKDDDEDMNSNLDTNLENL